LMKVSEERSDEWYEAADVVVRHAIDTLKEFNHA